MFEEEWGGLGLIATEIMFSWPEQEEEGKPDEVCDGLGSAISISTALVVVVEDVNRDGADAAGGRVFVLVGAELMLEVEVDVPQMIFSGVCGPHAGKDLSNGA
eukprot:14175792-Ditylum_brightwellii.AAC.1